MAEGMSEAELAYESGDYCRALRLFRRAADLGDARSQFMLARMYEKGRGTIKDDAQSAIWCRAAADRGLARAMRELGLKYQSGRGVPPDGALALAWLLKAAHAGDSPAMHVLGEMYHAGRGVPRDLAEAARWFRRESERTGRGSWELARMLEEGRGVPVDLVEAYVQYSLGLAREFSLPSELEAIERLRARLTPAQLAQAESRLKKAPPPAASAEGGV